MPAMDGMDCIRTFRAWEKLHRPSSCRRQFVVGMSAHASEPDVQTALRLGMDTYRDKPLTFATIKALTEQIALGISQPPFDITGDDSVDAEDRRFWVKNVMNTWFGEEPCVST